jgi:hypothetical protein
MMHGHEKTAPIDLLGSNSQSSAPPRSQWSEGRGPRGMWAGNTRSGISAGCACHRRRNTCGKQLPFGPEVGAVCGKAASTDLCGGAPSNGIYPIVGLCGAAALGSGAVDFCSGGRVRERGRSVRP